MARTNTEKIANIQEQITQLENQKKRLIQAQRAEDRKARTRRLIERGAILESQIDGADALTNDQIKLFLEKTIKTEYARRILQSLKTSASQQAETARSDGRAASPDTGGETAQAV